MSDRTSCISGILKSYYNLSSVTIFVCPLTTRPFMDLRASNLAGRSIYFKKLLSSYYNLLSVCLCENQGGNPIGKALVLKKKVIFSAKNNSVACNEYLPII